MGEAGIFGEDDRTELVEGEIVEMTPIGWRHAEMVTKLTMIFCAVCGGWVRHKRAEPHRARHPRWAPAGSGAPADRQESHASTPRRGRVARR